MSTIKINPIKNNLPRNAFDLSQRDIYSQPIGLLTPVFCKEVNPHDHVEINVDTFTRIRGMQSPAFTRLYQNYQFYFVPYRVLWSYWDTFITGLPYRQTLNSSSLAAIANSTNKSTNKIPTFNLHNVAQNFVDDDDTDSYGYACWATAFRYLDMLGYASYDSLYNDTTNDKLALNYQCNPFRILAFEKIYQDHYTNRDYETGDIRPDNYNVDNVTGTGEISDSTMIRALLPKYALWKKDYYNNVIPTLLYDQVDQKIRSFVGYSGWASAQGTGNFNNPKYNDIVPSTNNSGGTTYPTQPSNTSNNVFPPISAMSTSSLRNMFALEKLLEITRRAGKNYDDQIAAHFGFETPHNGRIDESKYIGGVQNQIGVSEVVSNAETADAPLGALAGLGRGNVNGIINYDAVEHGVIIGVSYIAPEAEFAANGIDPFNIKFNKEDYFQPESENLGMQPLYKAVFNGNGSTRNDILGWQPRYSEYKDAFDKVHFGYANRNNSLSTYCAPRFTTDTDASLNVGYNNLHIDPSVCDALFAYKYNGTVDTDPFEVCQNIGCKIVRDMSIQGMPKLGI